MNKLKIVAISTLFFICAIAFSSVIAEQKIEPSYVNVQIFDGDSLWSIAAEHPHEGMSMPRYIEEIKRVNGIQSDKIIAGRYLVVPVYIR